jgi:PAS domain S-box-containing protein
VVASQAAVSLENSRLYRDLAEREAKIRRLVEANIIGIIIFNLEGHILEANDAFLRMLRYDREDLVSGRLRWTDLTPPEWQGQLVTRAAELINTGTGQPCEKEYFRKDGSRVPVLVGGAIIEADSNQAVAFVLDLTERKRAEESLLESERRYHTAQIELAHANRVVTIGQLSTSIAHEVNQPMAAALINAAAGLRRLDETPPDLDRVRQALDRIVANAARAGDVISRMRALLKKTPLREEKVEINAAIIEVALLTRGEVAQNGITLQTNLAEDLPPIRGDRIQLQQVILNLVVNAVEALSSTSEGVRQLTISTDQAKPGELHVVVRDTGPGLDSSNLERVFDAFYTTKPGGLGIGLSICRSIIEAHRGQLWATANTPRGVAFQFTLPAPSDSSKD